MPDRQAQERLEDWRVATRAESVTEEGSVARRRATAATRRARWAFEDAAAAASLDHGGAEPASRAMRRALTRLSEANSNASEISRGWPGGLRPTQPETEEQQAKTLADEAEFSRELGGG